MSAEREQLLNEARQFYLAAPLLHPLLAKRRELILVRILQQHREGRTDYTSLVAELAVISDLEREIRTKEQTYDALMEATNGHARK